MIVFELWIYREQVSNFEKSLDQKELDSYFCYQSRGPSTVRHFKEKSGRIAMMESVASWCDRRARSWSFTWSGHD